MLIGGTNSTTIAHAINLTIYRCIRVAIAIGRTEDAGTGKPAQGYTPGTTKIHPQVREIDDC